MVAAVSVLEHEGVGTSEHAAVLEHKGVGTLQGIQWCQCWNTKV